MTIIAQNKENDQREISSTLEKFYADYGVAVLLRADLPASYRHFLQHQLPLDTFNLSCLPGLEQRRICVWEV